MKVFISYSSRDQRFARRLATSINEAGIDTWIADLDLMVGDNIVEAIQKGIEECDYMVAVLSPNFLSSRWTRQELNVFMMREMSQDSMRIIPALVEDCDIPVFLRDRAYVDFRGDFDVPLSRLLETLGQPQQTSRHVVVPAEVTENRKQTSQQLQISRLREHYQNGELSLVCGAGISVAAGVPAWENLLDELLTNLFGKQLPHQVTDVNQQLASLYQDYFNPSPLVVAQYLKNGLGNDFLKIVRDALYRNSPVGSPLIDAIVELCRPQRASQPLHSIINFNFDDLIEHNLETNRIKYEAVYAEGQKPPRASLPIYHVHGFLPRRGDLSEHDVVFSEDAYHSQFIDPFSWSNLVQLNHFGQNVCVFLGLSMTDPNLRRLLDVAMRKNPARTTNHYVFKKKHDPHYLRDRIESLGADGEQVASASDFITISEMLEEQDASNLGLNTIWIDSYDEIPSLLSKIAADDESIEDFNIGTASRLVASQESASSLAKTTKTKPTTKRKQAAKKTGRPRSKKA